MMNTKPDIAVDIWSDYVCPFCYLELPLVRQLDNAFPGRLAIHWRAFELRPDPVPTLDPDGDYLHDIWGRSVYPMAEQRGMCLRLPPVQPRSRKAFEAVAHARQASRFEPMHAALFQAFFEDGKDIGDTKVLVSIGESIGLDGSELNNALNDSRYLQQVLDDEQLARSLGVQGVPITLVRRADQPMRESLALRGAVPYEHLHAAVLHVAGSA